MKKLIAIMLLFIHVFNIGGQLVFHEYLVYQSDKLFNEEINKNHYNTDDLTEIKIPANMPGIHDWHGYENLDGQVRFANSSYNYVKMKLTRDTIYLMCIPNYETTHLYDQNVIYAGQIKDIPVPKKDHVPFGKINLIAYSHHCESYKFATPVVTVRETVCNKYTITPSPFITGPGQPPDMETNLS
jgi:hypothetical protein